MKKLYLTLIALLALAGLGNAVSIIPAKIEMVYSPDQSTQFTFYIAGANRIESYIAGDLAPYATLFDPFNASGPRHISVTLRLPSSGTLEPGRHTLLVGAKEMPGFGAADIGGIAAIQAPIYVEVPYPGVFLTLGMTYSDGDINSVVPVTISTTNKGTSVAKGVSATLEIYRNGTGERMFSLSSASRDLNPFATANFKFSIDTTGWELGSYLLRGILTYSDGRKEIERLLKLGTIGLKINGFTRKFVAKSVNPFIIEIENTGSTPLQGVFGELRTGQKVVRTAPIDLLEGWSKANLTGYLDTSDLSEGVHEATAVAYFAGRTAEMSGQITIGAAELQAAAPAPEGISGSSVIIALLLIITGTALLYARRRNHSNPVQ